VKEDILEMQGLKKISLSQMPFLKQLLRYTFKNEGRDQERDGILETRSNISQKQKTS